MERRSTWLGSRGISRIFRFVAYFCLVIAECAFSPVVEHLCCEAYKILHPDGRRLLGCSCGMSDGTLTFSGSFRVPPSVWDEPYSELLAEVLHFFG